MFMGWGEEGYGGKHGRLLVSHSIMKEARALKGLGLQRDLQWKEAPGSRGIGAVGRCMEPRWVKTVQDAQGLSKRSALQSRVPG